MSKAVALVVIVLLVTVSLNQAARLLPADNKDTGEIIPENVDEGCEGAGEEERLMRRTLVAHTDYIYTQHHKP